MVIEVKVNAGMLLAQPHLWNLRKQVESFPGPPSCWEITNHPRDGLRPCLTVLDSRGRCALAHRHVK